MHKIIYSLTVAVVTLTIAQAADQFVIDIKECPPLTPRLAPTSVHDLRPDDIKIIGALGDSIVAGFGAKGFNNKLTPVVVKEYRGLSYIIGGDKNAFTVPNYIKHYQPDLTGYSVGEHFPQFCNFEYCNGSYQPDLDFLNAAQSGATAMHLDHQLTYLIDRMRSLKGIDFENDWKMISIQTSSNDMCQSCNPSVASDTTPEKYGQYIEAVVDRIKANIPKVYVNLLDAFNIAPLFHTTDGKAYCNHEGSILSTSECPCGATEAGLEKLMQLTEDYNKKLLEIHNKHQKNRTDGFAVVFQQVHINSTSLPVKDYSDYDCFHPGAVAHKWYSKEIWNQFFTPQSKKPKNSNFHEGDFLYCPVDTDRFATS